MKRRSVLKSVLAGATALAAPKLVLAEAQRQITFVPHADLVSLDPVWTTADITRNYSLAVFDTLYGYDAAFQVQPQMVGGQQVSEDGKTWELTLRDGLKFHDGTPVLARDCVASVARFSKRDPYGQALAARDRRNVGAIGQGDPDPAEEAVQPAAGRSGPGLLRHHARTAGDDGPAEAGHRRDRQRSVPLPRGRTHPRLARGVRAQRRLRAAPGRRPQLQRGTEDRLYRPCRVELHPRPVHRLGGADAGGGGLVGEPDHRPDPAAQDQQGPGDRPQGPHRRDRLPALQPSVSAVRQSRRAPRGRGRDRPEGGHGGGGRRRTLDHQDRCRHVRARARRWRARWAWRSRADRRTTRS